MNTPFGTWSDFMHGRVFQLASTDASNEAIRAVRGRGSKLLRTVVACTVVGSAGTWKVGNPVPYQHITGAVRIDLGEHWAIPGAILRSRLVESRRYLGLTQRETAMILHLSEFTVEKFEEGVISEPGDESRERYLALISLASLFRSAFGNQHYMPKHELREVSDLYAGLSPIEYASQNLGGIYDILSVESRKYA